MSHPVCGILLEQPKQSKAVALQQEGGILNRKNIG